jgi:transcriptional regulator with XRE-family HTH domain
MENVLMRFCRETRRYTVKNVAEKLGVPPEAYREMEKGDLLLTRKQAELLGQLYNADASYFYREAVQLDLLQTRMAIIKIVKRENILMGAKLKKNEVAAIKRNVAATEGDIAVAQKKMIASQKELASIRKG